MLSMAALQIIFLFAVTLNQAFAMTIVHPEVVPGADLPSLKEVGITSAELYNMTMPNTSTTSPPETTGRAEFLYYSLESLPSAGLVARFDPRCGPSDYAYTNVQSCIACYDYLRGLGRKMCGAPPGLKPARFCTSGNAAVSAQSLNPSGSSSYW